MHLNFQTVEKKQTKEGLYLLQKADVTKNPLFWKIWRNNKLSISKQITLQKGDGGKWYAFRCVADEAFTSLPPMPFTCAYSLRSIERLLPFQIRSVGHLCNALINHGRAVDGSDTGLGKTYVALKVCEELHLRPIIICKLAGIANWKSACEYMRIKPLAIVNWEFAKSISWRKGSPSKRKFPFIEITPDPYDGKPVYTWNAPKNSLVLFDEAHVAAVKGSLNYALYTGSAKIPSITISATLADRPARFDGFFKTLGIQDEKTFETWLKARSFVNLSDERESFTDLDDMMEINKLLYPEHGYRLSYSDEDVKAYFPEAVFQTMVVSLSDEATNIQNQLYQTLLADVYRYREMKKQADALVADLRYRQETELLKVPVLMDVARDLMGEGKSVCIFVNFRRTMQHLAKSLKTASLIYGEQHRDHIYREEVINAFQANEKRIIICMVDAGGQSINLHDLHGGHQRVSLICPTYNPITLKQVMGRTYRAGCKSVPIIKLVYAANTVEEKVAKVVGTKLGNIAALNDGDLMEPDIFNLGVVRKEEVTRDDEPVQTALDL